MKKMTKRSKKNPPPRLYTLSNVGSRSKLGQHERAMTTHDPSKHIERKKEAERQSSLSSDAPILTTTEAAYVAQIRFFDFSSTIDRFNCGIPKLRFNDFCFLVSPSPSPAYGVNLASERR
ncbi:hypothetical protein L1987_14418 [Smallanthus sonchifolius]|uniref:Uncharacterized protein n=1 Tax=Smallanthus sonchifolius TaxID=185202 RepID=A0ACB9J3L3_9ASTR|nr:hypothetical protein L1987_14418 [Smallanthus sonchifolius]